MQRPKLDYAKADFIETENGNKISRKAIICGSQNIVLGGKSIIEHEVVLRGDLKRASAAGARQSVVLALGKFCIVRKRASIRPPYKMYRNVFTFYPVRIGDHVYIGEESIIEAASIGNFVFIGKNCVIGRFTVVKDCVYIPDNSVVPANTVLASFTTFSRRVSSKNETTPFCMQRLLQNLTEEIYLQTQ